MEAMKLIVGLGNPGEAYARNRHNVGFMCLDHIAKRHTLAFDKRLLRAQIARGKIAGSEVMLVKPRTYMNLSGQAVSSLVRKFGIPPGDLVVICDDLDLPLGKTRLRPSGGSGGHKGVESIISSLASQDFPRIRVGIGCSEEEGDTIDYVLSNFPLEERGVIEGAIAKVADLIHCFIAEGIEAAMNEFN